MVLTVQDRKRLEKLRAMEAERVAREAVLPDLGVSIETARISKLAAVQHSRILSRHYQKTLFCVFLRF